MWNLISSNRLLTEREKNHQRQKHLERLKSVKGSINNRAPSKPVGKPRIEKAQLLRNKEIEFENENLLKRMINIDRKPSKLHPLHYRPRPASSLNRQVRYKALDNIYEQNRRLLERLQEASSVYSFNRWEQDFVQNSYYSNKIKENSARMGAWGRPKRTLSPERKQLLSLSASNQNIVNKTLNEGAPEEARSYSSTRPPTSQLPQRRSLPDTMANASFSRKARGSARPGVRTPQPYVSKAMRKGGNANGGGTPQKSGEELDYKVGKMRKSSPLIQPVLRSQHSRHLSNDHLVLVKQPRKSARKKNAKAAAKTERENADPNEAPVVEMASPQAVSSEIVLKQSMNERADEL